MLNTSFSIDLLKYLTIGASFTRSQSGVYLGLLTRLPDDANHMTNNPETGYQEVNRKYSVVDGETGEETSIATGYARIRIGLNGASATGLSGTQFFTSNPAWDDTEGVKAVVIKNAGDDIQMHNISEEYSGAAIKICGFGLFSAQTDGNMYACGPLVDANGDPAEATLTAGSVPIFYKDNLTLMMKDNDPVSQSSSSQSPS